METLKRIDFVCALVDAKLLTPPEGLQVLNSAGPSTDDFAAHLRVFGLVVEEAL